MRRVKHNPYILREGGPTGDLQANGFLTHDYPPNVVNEQPVGAATLSHCHFRQFLFRSSFVRTETEPLQSLAKNETTTSTSIPGQDALTLLSFSRRASSLKTAATETYSLGNRNVENYRRSVSLSSEATCASSIMSPTSSPGKKSSRRRSIYELLNKNLAENNVAFRYPVDFCAGVALREKVLLPTLQNHHIKEVMNEKEIGIKLGTFFRGEKVWITSIFPKTNKNKVAQDETNLKNGYDHESSHITSVGTRKRSLSQENDCNDNGNKYPRHNASTITHNDRASALGEEIKGQNQNPSYPHNGFIQDESIPSYTNPNRFTADASNRHEHQEEARLRDHSSLVLAHCTDMPPLPAQIQRCTVNDTETLALWYTDGGDKYLPHTSSSWSEWWEKKCVLPDPACEMIKLVLGELVLGVAYYERNILDLMSPLPKQRTTLLRGIRINPKFNPFVARRSTLARVSTPPVGTGSVPEDTLQNSLCTTLFTAVLLRSLLCGTSSVTLNCRKDEMEEKFYDELFGEPVALREDDGRRCYAIHGEERFQFLQFEFLRQLDMHLRTRLEAAMELQQLSDGNGGVDIGNEHKDGRSAALFSSSTASTHDAPSRGTTNSMHTEQYETDSSDVDHNMEKGVSYFRNANVHTNTNSYGSGDSTIVAAETNGRHIGLRAQV